MVLSKKTAEMFEGAKFIISLYENELDDVVYEGIICYIDINQECGCCSREQNKLKCYSQTGQFTNKDLIKRLIQANYEPICGHFFLEKFTVKGMTVTPFWGS